MMFRYPDKPLGNMAAPGLADLPALPGETDTPKPAPNFRF